MRQLPGFNADGVNLRNVFGYGQQMRHGPERLACVIHIQPRNNHTHTHVGQLIADFWQSIVEKLRFIYSYYFSSRSQQ